MRRAPIVLGSTAAGLGLMLSFHTHNPGLSGLATASGAAGPKRTPAAVPATAPATAGPATAAPATTAPAAQALRKATGQLIGYRYGDIELQVTERGSRITDITVVQEDATDARSEEINSQAVPLLQQQAMSAQSARINGVSGATFTSYAYVQALQSALDQLPR